MTADEAKRRPSFTQKRFGQNWNRFGLLVVGLLLALAIIFLIARWHIFAPPTLQTGDLLLLEPESIQRVEEAAKAGDIVAQSTLGSAYLQGRLYVPRNVTKAVYWLRKVADRDRDQFDRIPARMHSLLQRRQHEFDLRKRHAMSLDFLDLFAEKLAFESAVLGLIEVYLGRQGSSYANAELALKYIQLGVAYGFPSAQRKLGIITQFGLFGVQKNEVEATILLSEAAATGDRVAQKLLFHLRSYP